MKNSSIVVLGLLFAGLAHAGEIRCLVQSLDATGNQSGFDKKELSSPDHTEKSKEGRVVVLNTRDVENGLYSTVKTQFERDRKEGYLELEVVVQKDGDSQCDKYSVRLSQHTKKESETAFSMKWGTIAKKNSTGVEITLPGDGQHIMGTVSCSYHK